MGEPSRSARASSLLAPPIGFAHRGASAQARENTLEAFELALELGAGGLESDVWVTLDGVPVLDHDGELETGHGVRPIAELRRAELPRHVPTLSELYAVCGPNVPLSLDVKDEAAGPPTLEVARSIRAERSLWLCHWNWKVVAGWRELSPDVRLVDSTRAERMRTPPESRAERMKALGIDAINLPWRDWSDEMVDVFHARGRYAFAWDAQERRELRSVLALGVDAVYSDHVERMMEALSEEGS
jgi:glycerophosphoryl diester phosphodiesterase